jgi:hypothetical protein
MILNSLFVVDWGQSSNREEIDMMTLRANPVRPAITNLFKTS